jgi:transcriptional regulator with GAF, ATPase, and Fis domain
VRNIRCPDRPNAPPAQIFETKRPVQIPDLTALEPYRNGTSYSRGLVDLGGIRSLLDVPLLKEGVVLGFIAIYREEIGPFSDKQIALLQDFADQAVMAMEAARLLGKLRQRTEEVAGLNRNSEGSSALSRSSSCRRSPAFVRSRSATALSNVGVICSSCLAVVPSLRRVRLALSTVEGSRSFV